jgi:hypothetical protein
LRQTREGQRDRIQARIAELNASHDVRRSKLDEARRLAKQSAEMTREAPVGLTNLFVADHPGATPPWVVCHAWTPPAAVVLTPLSSRLEQSRRWPPRRPAPGTGSVATQ